VREYFVVDPYGESVTAFGENNDGHFSKKTVYGSSDVLKFDTFAELEIPLAPIFEELAPFGGE
jgi:Uma2 family endonuclease